MRDVLSPEEMTLSKERTLLPSAYGSIPYELVLMLRSLQRFTYYVTPEEDNLLWSLYSILDKHLDRVWMFHPEHGKILLKDYVASWLAPTRLYSRVAHAATPMDIHTFLKEAQLSEPRDESNFYIIPDAEDYFPDPKVVRRLKDIAQQLHNDIRTVKLFIFVANMEIQLPSRIQQYFETVLDPGLRDEEIERQVRGIASALRAPYPEHAAKIYKGLTSFQIDTVCARSVIVSRRGYVRVDDPETVKSYREKRGLYNAGLDLFFSKPPEPPTREGQP